MSVRGASVAVTLCAFAIVCVGAMWTWATRPLEKTRNAAEQSLELRSGTVLVTQAIFRSAEPYSVLLQFSRAEGIDAIGKSLRGGWAGFGGARGIDAWVEVAKNGNRVFNGSIDGTLGVRHARIRGEDRDVACADILTLPSDLIGTHDLTLRVERIDSGLVGKNVVLVVAPSGLDISGAKVECGLRGFLCFCVGVGSIVVLVRMRSRARFSQRVHSVDVRRDSR